VWCGDGTLVVTSVAEGALYRVFPEEHRAERFADTGGGANGAALAADGSILVTQNGGIDFSALGLFKAPPVFRPGAPGLQHVSADGTVTYLADDGFHAPNDLAIAPDGTVYFTDPGHFPPESEDGGRVMVYARDGTVREHASRFWFCNGIAFAPDGTMVVVERLGLQKVFPDGSREWLIEHLGKGGGDGFCFDAEGRAYVASTIEHGVRVVDTDGTIVDFLEIDGNGLTTNCCFGGADGRTLYATEALPGNVVAWQHMPVAGLELPTWPGPVGKNDG
jgi:sugar lactone lactonase YvrE